VAIATALATVPQLLVLDEPTSQLDPLAAQEVLGAVERLNVDLGLTVVIAEHRLDRVLPFADTLVSMSAGAFESGPTRRMLASLTEVPPLVELARICGWEPLPLTVRDARHFVDLSRPPRPAHAPARTPGDVLVQVRDAEFRYERTPVLRGINLDGYAGEVVALVGRNGSGKTTLLRLLSGLLRPSRGVVRLGQPPADSARVPVQQIARSVGYVPQHPSSILHQETVHAELAFTARSLQRDADIEATLELLDLLPHAQRNPLDLSGGERQRVALAALAVGRPPVLLLDEPTRGLPAGDKQRLAAFARAYADAGRLVIVATHDVDFVAAVADRVLLLADGEIVAAGSPRDVLAGSLAFAPQLNRLFGSTVLTLNDALAALR
jgi:energy-coupling factor transport system ATP-binding protein